MKKKKILWIIVGIVLVLAAVLCGGFTYLYFNGLSGMSQVSEPSADQVKVACVGDSITYGHGISNWPENNYPKLLQGLLGEDFHVNSYAVSGRAVHPDSDQPYTELEHYQQSIAYDADILVFMMGSNDAKPENWFGGAAFREELEKLLDSYNVPEIYLCTPATAFFMNGQTEGKANYDIQPAVVEEIADIVRAVASERGYVLIDINDLTEDHPDWFSTDGIHPNNYGALQIALAVYRAINVDAC